MKKLLLLIIIVSVTSMAGANSTWVRNTNLGPGNWNDPCNWNFDPCGITGGVPDWDDTNITIIGQNINNMAEAQVTDEQTFGNRLRLGNSNHGGVVRIMSGGELSSGDDAPIRSYVGDSYHGQMIVDAGGTFNHEHRLYIGNKAGVHGTVDVYGTINMYASGARGRTFVGEEGTGFLNIFSGGVYNADSDIYIGYRPGGVGTVNVHGTVTVDDTMVGTIALPVADGGGPGGRGTLNIYPGGVYDNTSSFASDDFSIKDDSMVNFVGGGILLTSGNELADAEILIAGGRFATWGVIGDKVSASYDGSDTIIAATDPNDPLNRWPGYDEEVILAGLDVDLSWDNVEAIPDPCSPVWVDVWFGADMTWGPNESDPNIYEYADWTKIVDAGQDTITKTVTVSSDPNASNRYYWRVYTYRHGDPATVSYDPNGFPWDTRPLVDEGMLFPFTAFSDIPPTVVHDTAPIVHWVNEPITVYATVSDDGESALTVLWDSGNESEPNITFGTPVTVFPPGTVYPQTVSTTVSVNYATNNYNVRVRVTDDAGTHRPDHVVHQCRQDACDAARYWNGQNGGPQGPAVDVNDDCAIDIVDLNLLALKWLFDYTITEATAIPQ